jgi:hypothetical protein
MQDESGWKKAKIYISFDPMDKPSIKWATSDFDFMLYAIS